MDKGKCQCFFEKILRKTYKKKKKCAANFIVYTREAMQILEQQILGHLLYFKYHDGRKESIK